MTAFYSRFRMVAVLAAACLLPVAAAPAQDASKAAVVVAVNNLNELFNDLTAVSQWAGAADQVGFPLMMGRAALSKVDQNKPLGAYLTFENNDLKPLIFLPVEDLNALLSQLKDQVGTPKDLGDNLLELRANGQTLYIRKGNGWAYISNDSKALSKTLGDPTAALSEFTKRYDIAVQVRVQNVPNDLRQVAMTQIKSAMESATRNNNNGDPAMQEQMRKNLQRSIDVMFEEVDTITIGLTMDAKEKTMAMEFALTAKEGTELAQQMAGSSESKSLFAGLITEASAASMYVVNKLNPQDVDQAIAGLTTARQQAIKSIDNDGRIPDQAVRDTAKNAVNSILDAIEATVRGGKLDFGASVVLEEDEFHLLAGGSLVDGAKLEDGIKKLVDLARNAPDVPDIRLNVESHQGVNFHIVEIPLDGADENVREALGDSLEVTLGIGKERMYLAIGEDGIGSIKQGMLNGNAGKSTSVLPMQMQIALTPIMKFAAGVGDDPNLQRIAKLLAQTEGKDHIRLTSRPIPRGTVGRLEIEQGVLKAIGSAAGGQRGKNGF